MTGHSRGVITGKRCVIVTVTESEPGDEGPAPFAVALVTPAPLMRWKVTLKVAPETTEPDGVPLLELSSAAWFATVATELPPAAGSAVVTVTAVGPLPVPAHTLLAVLCWYEDTAMRSAWRAEFVTDSRK